MRLIRSARRGVPYSSYRCTKCGEEIFTMEQAEAYLKAAEKARNVTFSKWGEALAVRIPSDVVRKFRLKAREKGKLIDEGDGFKIIPPPT